MEINSGLPQIVEPLRLRKNCSIEKLEQATLDSGHQLAPAQIARYQKFYDRTISDVDTIRDGRLPCLKTNLEQVVPGSGSQLACQLALLQGNLQDDRALVGRLELERQYHGAASQSPHVAQSSSPPPGDFSKIVEKKGEKDPYWESCGSLDSLLARLKLSPDSPQARSLKEVTQKLSGLLDPSDLFTTLQEVIKRVGINNALTILNKLSQLRQLPANLAGGLISSILNDVARPTEVNQQDKGTCASAAMQVKMAGQDPVRYVDMMTRLGLGQSVESGGITFKAPPNWKNQHDLRTPSAKLFQATMQAARKDDTGEDGMTSDDSKRINQALFSDFWNPVEVHGGRGSQKGRAEMMAEIEDDIARGRAVSVRVVAGKEKGQELYHAILIIGIDKSVEPTRYEVFSWGQRFRLTAQELESCLCEVRTVDDWGFDNKQVPKGQRKTVVAAPGA